MAANLVDFHFTTNPSAVLSLTLCLRLSCLTMVTQPVTYQLNIGYFTILSDFIYRLWKTNILKKIDTKYIKHLTDNLFHIMSQNLLILLMFCFLRCTLLKVIKILMTASLEIDRLWNTNS